MRNLPSVNAVLNQPEIAKMIDSQGRELVTYAVRRAIVELRSAILEDRATCSGEAILRDVSNIIDSVTGESLKPVMNASGVVLHTNLGRAPLGRKVFDEISRIAAGYSNLEYDLTDHRRGHRDRHAAALLSFLTSAEDVLAVNNNAAGIMLSLNTLANGREVIISRGELIEIGGSFRIPDIMQASGARMVEVGTTNKTRLSDYEAAIGPQTALIFKAHQSNFAMIGFTESVSARELAALAHAHDLPVVFDLGSGLLRKAGGTLCENEPDVRGAIDSGWDLVLLSCDKLLGGPQAGIVAGRKPLILQLRKSPLMRVLRVGKLTLAALSAVCRQYLEEQNTVISCPVQAFLRRCHAELRAMASRLSDDLTGMAIPNCVLESEAQCGGGTLPGVSLKSYAIEIRPPEGKWAGKVTFAEQLFGMLQNLERPIVAILREGKLLLDVLALFEEDFGYICRSLADSIKGIDLCRRAWKPAIAAEVRK